MNTGYIYKLVCRDLSIKDVYVGSTKDMRQRKYVHKSDCNNVNGRGYNYNVYQFIRAHGGFDNWNMILVETVRFNIRAELHARERHWYEQLNATLNSEVPNRMYQEWYQANKETIAAQKKRYQQANKAKIAAQKKRYQQANKKAIAAYQHQYGKQRIKCDFCGCTISQGNKAQHIKTKMHQTNFKNAWLECFGEEYIGDLTSECY